jgi:methylphosphotriester-DNA--protein-cysteine methyltransferase
MSVKRPFDDHRFVGDKRTMVFHDLTREQEGCRIDEIVEAEAVQLFGPDSPAEARNRGYRPCALCSTDLAETA